MTTPNMGLLLPSPGVTPGPTYASELNTALETIDSHGHTGTDGVRLGTAALNINADLTCNDYALTSVGYVGLTAQSSAISTGSLKIFSYGGELYYRDASSNNVRITLSGAVDAGATGAITGLSSPASASFSSITDTFSWQEDTNKFAKMANADIKLYEYNATSPNPITIKSPASLGASYTLTLPAAVPADTYPLTMSAAGVLTNSGTVQLAAGLLATPSLYFAGDTGTGLYRPGANQLGLAISGVDAITISSTAITTGKQILSTSLLSATTPDYSYAADPDTGMRRANTNSLALTTGGEDRLQITTSSITTTLPLYSTAGSVGFPTYTFTGDTDTGFYSVTGNSIGVAAGGGRVARFTATGNTSEVDLTVTGALAATSLNLSSGGAFKVTVYTGSLAASDSTALSPGAIVYGAFGYSQYDGGAAYTPMPVQNTFGADTVSSVYFNLGTSTSVEITNGDTNSTNAYRVIVFHA